MFQTHTRKLKNLQQKIRTSRRKLQTLWETHGCTNAAVLAAGNELDELLNEYQRVIGERREAKGDRGIGVRE